MCLTQAPSFLFFLSSSFSNSHPHTSGCFSGYLTNHPASIDSDPWLDNCSSSYLVLSQKAVAALLFSERKVITPTAGMLIPALMPTISLHKSSLFFFFRASAFIVSQTHLTISYFHMFGISSSLLFKYHPAYQRLTKITPPA